jgi:hypothetical protein
MNTGKHKKGQVQEWLEGEEIVPSHSRSAHLLAAYIKLRRPAARKYQSRFPGRAAPRPAAALMRDPAPPIKTAPRHSQAASWEHLQKMQRLAPLRAPFPYKPKQHLPQGAVTRLRSLTSSAPPRRLRRGSPFRK